MMMLGGSKCIVCDANSVEIPKSNQVSGISQIRILDRQVLITDTSILFCILNGYHTVSKIREALDNAYFKKTYNNIDEKLVLGGRTEGNLRARLKILERAGLVIINTKKSSSRIPSYEITNLGIAVQNVFIAGLDLFSKACSDCITKRIQVAIRPIEVKETLGKRKKLGIQSTPPEDDNPIGQGDNEELSY